MEPNTPAVGAVVEPSPNTASTTPAEANGVDSAGNPTKVVDALDPANTDHTQQVFEDVAQNLPAAEAVVSDLSTVKSGYRTSEWWITLAISVVTLAGGLLPANSVWVKCVAAASAALTTLGYVASRTVVKRAASK